MIWIIVPIGIVIMGIYSFFSYKNAKNYYLNHSDELIEESKPLEEKILSMVKTVRQDIDNTIFVNGHFTKQVSVGLKVTTYYSYALLLDKNKNKIQVITYNPEKKVAQDNGTYDISNVSAVDVGNGYQTNYIFKDIDGKESITVNTLGHEVPTEDGYQIKIFQEENYNTLRNAFNLPPYHHAEQFGGKK